MEASFKNKFMQHFNTYLFFSLHLIPIYSLIWMDVTLNHVYMMLLSYALGMLGIVIGYHRYFSHRAFRTNRLFQFILAFWAESSSQKGVLWWAGYHRMHHKYSDGPQDAHSPVQWGFWRAHFGWWLLPDKDDNNEDNRIKIMKDFSKYPEIVWLDYYWWVPPTVIGSIFFFVGSPTALAFSYFGCLVFLWHGTFTINSLAHQFGRQRYKTNDQSRNNWFLALITHGEGWHNNHHHYMHSARQGFLWFEYDIGYYCIKLLSLLKIVSHVKEVPKHVLESKRIST